MDGIPAKLVVDTGASQALILRSWFVEKHKLRERYPKRLNTVTGLGSRILPPPKRVCAGEIACLKSTECPFNHSSPGRSSAPFGPSPERASAFAFKPAGKLRERQR